jgi:hypothetical protein
MNDLMLMAGVDIPFPGAQVSIHQPSIKEIGLIGEESFYSGCGTLNFSKNSLSLEDRIALKDYTDFEILMSMINNKSFNTQQNRIDMMMILTLIFPEYQIHLKQNEIDLIKEGESHLINSGNFEEFKKILTAMFCLKGKGNETEYNPSGNKAREIIEKLNKRKQKLAEQNGDQKVSVLNRFASILAVGQKQDLNEILDYTVYQLFDQFDRFTLKEQFDIHLKAQLAGARDLGEIEDWKKDLHP